MINYGDVSKKLILGPRLHFMVVICYFNVGPMVLGRVGEERSKVASKMVLKYFNGFEYNHEHGDRQKNSSTTVDKIVQIRSRLAKYNVFCGTEASSIIISVTQFGITKN